MINVDDLLDSFRDTTLHVIMSMAKVKLEPGEMRLTGEDMHKCDVIGNINLTGEEKLSLSLNFSNEAVKSIYRCVFPDDPSDVDPRHIGDLVGEITNMVCGNARNILSELGMRFEATTPTVIVGVQRIYHPEGTISKQIPISVNGHPMSVQINIKEE